VAKIKAVRAREVLDSRGFPTVEVDVDVDGATGRAIVPSGASTGDHEAIEMRDGDASRFLGKGVLSAVHHVHAVIGPKLIGMDAGRQKLIDDILVDLDGTQNKSKLGANSILAVSLAVAHAAAKAEGKPLFESLSHGKGMTLPVPFMNIVNGGAHADNAVDFQEFMIVPGGFATFHDALRAGVEVFHHLKAVLKSRGQRTTVGDEGGFAPDFKSVDDVLDTVMEAIRKSGYKPGEQVALALDVAASEFCEDRVYTFKKGDKSKRTSAQMIELYEGLRTAYPLVSIEDGLDEDDWDGWRELTKRLGSKTQLVGDDLFVTNTSRLRRGIQEKVGNSILVKVNQIGSLSETVAAVLMAQEAGYSAIISHRSGETEDTTIADLAVALNTGMIKTGSASRTDRTAKYNQLLRIEETLGARARFAGFAALARTRS